MRRESLWLGLGLVLVLLAGCRSPGMKVETTVVDDGPAPRAPVKRLPGELSNAGAVNLGLAQQYLQVGHVDAALDRAQRALETDSDNGNVHAMLGLIYDRIGDGAKAGASFQKALALAPNSGSVLSAHGAYLCSRGDPDGAAANFQRALADPFYRSPGSAHYNAGQCLLRSGKAAQAEVELRKALERQGGDPAMVLMALAQAALAQGDTLEARAFVQRREAMGASDDVLELAARIEDAAGNPAAAARYRARLGGGDANNGGGTQSQ